MLAGKSEPAVDGEHGFEELPGSDRALAEVFAGGRVEEVLVALVHEEGDRRFRVSGVAEKRRTSFEAGVFECGEHFRSGQRRGVAVGFFTDHGAFDTIDDLGFERHQQPGAG